MLSRLNQYLRSEVNNTGEQVKNLLLAWDLMNLFDTSERVNFIKMKKSDRKKARYILSKLGESLDDIDHSGFTIEHIMPEEKSTGWKHVKESAEDYQALVSSIGNLTLINPSGNSSLKNKDFDSKKQVYNNQTMLTKTIVESVNTGTINTKHDKAIKAFNYDLVSGTWNRKEIERRAKALRNLAEHIWFKY